MWVLARQDGGMANGFLPVDRDQRFLLPVDMRDWLEGDHVVWFLIDVVERLDVSELRWGYQLGGRGRRAYDPAMLLTLLLYGLSQGVRSSRAMERACRSDAAFRVICGTWGETPDHATICRFRRRHEAAIRGLFGQVLKLAREVGLGRLGLVAIDGTKVGADASMGANRTEGWIRREVGRLLEEAEEADRAEETELGDEAGWEMPGGLGDRSERLERLERALENLESRQEHKRRGEGDEGEQQQEGRANMTDPDSRTMSAADGGFIQGYNCQVVTTEEGLVAAAEVTDQPNDYGQLSVMLDKLEENLAAVDVEDRPQVVVGDAGYFDTADIASVEDRTADRDKPLLLVATGKGRDQPTDPGPDPQEPHRQASQERDTAEQAERRRRAEVVERWDKGEIDYRQAAAEIGVAVPQAYACRNAWKEEGTAAIPVPRHKTGVPPPPRSKVIRYLLESRLADPANRDLYKQRGHLAETPFARMKEHHQLRRFARRGINAVNAEFLLHCLVHNLLRIRAHQQPA